MNKGADKPFFWIIVALAVGGFFIFISASLGIHAREGLKFISIARDQAVFGILLGFIAFLLVSKINYKFWNKYAFYLYIASLLLTFSVFIPGFGFSHGGATRWISLGAFTFQPAELLKIGVVLYLAAWYSGVKHKVNTLKYGALPLATVLAVSAIPLMLQPDTGTLLVISAAAFAIYFAAGARWLHITILGGLGVVSLGILTLFRPYVWTRVLTFLNPTADPLGAGYQIKQSLIAIGSGQWFGRGFGQSIQKFNFLPEPIGDSIFAVFAEEWGFVGSILLITLFVVFILRGLRIAARGPNTFARLLVTGIILLVVAQSFINIGSMLGIMPLTGMPLIFVSHGGTALLVALASMGIILNVSRYTKQ